MAEVNETVVAGLTAYYEYVAAHLDKWADPLSNEQFWRKPYPYGNSVGHLVLHVTGHLTGRLPWWRRRFESRRRRTGERRTRPSGNRKPRIASTFSCVVRGMRIIM